MNPASASAGGGAEGAPRPAAHIPSPCSVSWALSRCVDLTGVTKKSVLRLLAEHCSDAAEKRTLLYFAAKVRRLGGIYRVYGRKRVAGSRGVTVY